MINYCNGQRNLGEHGLDHAKLQPYIYLGLPISQKSGMYDVLTFVLKNGYYYRVSHKSDFTLFSLFSRVLEQVQRNF